MIEVHITAGDGDGGPYAKVMLELERDSADEVTLAECGEWREAIRTLFREGFGEDPEQVIVYVDESP
jgi:hypothetical protein